jgi:hypothetical protein
MIDPGTTRPGTDRVVVGNLRVARTLYDFITDEALPGTGIDPESFWAGVDKVVADLSPRNDELLARRDDLQAQILADVPGNPHMFEHVAKLAQGPWNTNGQLGLVVGATRPNEIERVRAVAPTLPLLIPGVGAQGGDAVATVKAARIGGGPIIINSSRAILYAGQGDDFAKAAREAAIATRATLQAAAQS